MKYNIISLLITINNPIYTISHPIVINIEFLIQYLLTINNLNVFKGIFQSSYIYSLKDIILELYC